MFDYLKRAWIRMWIYKKTTILIIALTLVAGAIGFRYFAPNVVNTVASDAQLEEMLSSLGY